MLITLELVRDTWRACYEDRKLAKLYDRPLTPLEVLTRKDGPWESVPPEDRLWTVFHEGVLTDKQFRLFAAACARRALEREKAAGFEPDSNSWEALKMLDQYNAGKSVELAEASITAYRGVKAKWGPAYSTAEAVASSVHEACATRSDQAAYYVAINARFGYYGRPRRSIEKEQVALIVSAITASEAS